MFSDATFSVNQIQHNIHCTWKCAPLDNLVHFPDSSPCRINWHVVSGGMLFCRSTQYFSVQFNNEMPSVPLSLDVYAETRSDRHTICYTGRMTRGWASQSSRRSFGVQRWTSSNKSKSVINQQREDKPCQTEHISLAKS